MRTINHIIVIPETYNINISFDNGITGNIYVGDLVGQGIFKKFENKDFFSHVSIINNKRGIGRDDDIDMCADALYEKVLSTQ